jgi:hypothetical protein
VAEHPWIGATLGIAVLLYAVACPDRALAAAVSAGTQTPSRAHQARADAPRSTSHTDDSTSRAPAGPPLGSGAGATELQAEEEESGGSPAGEVDPLVSNGLGSPTCKSGLDRELAPSARHDCETAGFTAAAAPTGDYGLDVHIDTGAFGFGSGWLMSTVQDLLVSPVWMALVWIAHSLIVMLEWGFSIDLLDGGSASTLGAGLAAAQRSLTDPWLPLALSVAAVLAAYHGLVRRRVAETLGEALVMVAMIAGGTWLILDPTGTVGALGRWSNQAGLGTLAVAVQGSPVRPGQALGVSMGGVFEAAIEGPWCYLEFGDVSWCREPAQLDPRLHTAGLKIAAQEIQQAGCRKAGSSCLQTTGEASQATLHSGRLLTEAHTNGAVFLALPANGVARNSINDHSSLLSAICRSDQATSCSGPAAAEAQFRTGSGTWSRVGGLLLIAIGLLGMTLLLGNIALRLLMAAVLSLFYLLLAPGIVLAPAFGEAGRRLFRNWLARLLGAVLSKLLLAFLLGVVLAVTAVLSGLEALGWWTQWLLMSAFWWGLFLKRHQLLSVAGEAMPQRASQRSITRRVRDVVDTTQRARNWRRKREPAPTVSETRPRASNERASSPGQPDRQAERLLRRGRSQGGSRKGGSSADGSRAQPLADARAQLKRVERAHADAIANGEGRRATRLDGRRQRLRSAIEQIKQERGHPESADNDDALRERATFLNRQALLPTAGRKDRSGERRDYATLAPLAGFSAGEFSRLEPARQRSARLEIDRELAIRRERQLIDGADAPSTGSHDRTDRPSPTPPRRGREPGSRAAAESDVMRDARAVAEGRKRRLGFDRE